MVEGYPYGLGEWRVGVFKEAGRLLGKYFGLLAPFIFAFVLPAALVEFLEVFGVAAWAAGQNPFLPPGPHPAAARLGQRFLLPRDDPAPPGPSGGELLLILAGGFVIWLLCSLAVASFCKTVESIYSEQEEDPSVIKSIFKSLPGAIFRLLVTSVWVLLLTLVTFFTIYLPFILLYALINDENVLLVLLILRQVFIVIADTILGFIFLLSQEVAVLEPTQYGLAALKRSSKLVQEKFLPALLLFVFRGFVSNLPITVAVPSKLTSWAVYILDILLLFLFTALMVYVLLVTVVLYFSSKVKYDAEQPSSLPVDNPHTLLVGAAEE